ncbi:MAG: GMC family oxidoreductase [Pseudomonas sp.]
MADFDVIVVGSGISGGWAAKELTEAGLKVLLLDRGRSVQHGEYPTEHLPPWSFKFRGLGDRKKYERDYPVQKQCSTFQESSEHFFVNDTENPYQVEDGTDFSWIRGYQLGGRSLTWGRSSLRYGEINFTEILRDGHGAHWPIRYRDLAPWYAHVEKFIGVCGQAAGLPQMPDGEFLPPMPMNCVEEHVAAVIRQRYDRVMMPGRGAVLTQAHMGRAPCHYCGPCYRGCSTSSYFSTQSSTLPAAMATGNLTVLTDVIVTAIEYDATAARASGIRVIDAKTGTGRVLSARIIFLNASTLATTQILLNSVSESFPLGLANSSGMLGCNLMDHVIGPMAVGRFEGFSDHQTFGNRPVDVLIPRFRNLGGEQNSFLRGYHYQGSAIRASWAAGTQMQELGADLKARLRKPGEWTMFLGGIGECLPNPKNRVTLDRRTDRWGVPQLRINFSWSENERRMGIDMANEAAAMLRAAGATDIQSSSELMAGGTCIHEAGTARMGNDPAVSVLDANNRCHDVPNLFVTDGACLPSSPNQNPSLTYMALTARAAHFARGMLAEGQL